VSPGEVLGFLGPNGAGKTTTMRMLAGFITPTSGKASICGHDVETNPLGAKASLGYLPEGAPTYVTHRVREVLKPGEIRGRMPRFQGENFVKNLALVEALKAIAAGKGCSTAQLAIAWVASRGGDVIPLIGARRRDQLRDAVGALDITLSPADIARIERAMPVDAVAGDRYGAALMTHLDSEH